MNFYLKLLIILAVFMAVSFCFMVQHEKVHKAIYENYGINSTIKYHFFSAETIATNTKNCNETCEMLHSQNEIMGYNVQVIFVSMFLIFMMFVAFRGWDKLT